MSKSKTESKKAVSKPTEAKGVDSVLSGLNAKDKKHIEEVMKKLEKIMLSYKEVVLQKFDKFVSGIALLPQNKENKEDINTLVLIDDSDTKKMTKFELKDRLVLICEEEAKKIDSNLKTNVMLVSELWQNLYDGKTELLQDISLSTFFHDNGILSGLKIGEIHKQMVLKKFEKYIVSYVFAGSIVQGRQTKESDIDVFIVIDDTDVKKMTRTELKDKLRSIILTMGFEAGELTGIKNKLNVQTYILTDFWEYMKEANPIIFTFLRDGVPLYDRGVFMPWKQLLKMGRVKPSKEAIDMFMNTGEQFLSRIKMKIRDIGLDDTFWATVTPSQAALMLYGLPPPTPKETPHQLREVFVQKEKILEEKYVKYLEEILKTRKDMEHGTKKDITGAEVDHLVDISQQLLDRLKKLFDQIETGKDKENIFNMYEIIVNICRDLLNLEGIKSVKEADLIQTMQTELVNKGKLPSLVIKDLKLVWNSVKTYKTKNLTKPEVHKTFTTTSKVIRELTDEIQRRRSKDLAKARIRVKYGKKFGELLLLGNTAFIIPDIDAEKKEYQKAVISKTGALTQINKSSAEEFENAISDKTLIPRGFIKQATIKDLENIFGKEVEILLNY